MSTPDDARIKAVQRETWNTVSAGWNTVRGQFETGAAPLTERMLEIADLQPGQAVLDVATGHGEPALTVARLVGPTGRVVGTDISASMLDIAHRRAVGFDNVEFIEADLESLDLPPHSFDAVLSRFGLMFAVNHAALFLQLRKLLRPGGILAAAVWGPVSQHRISVGPLALSDRLGLPPPNPAEPGPFSMSDPDRLRSELSAAGFVQVSIEEHTAPFYFSSIDEYAEYNRHALPPQLMRTARDRLGTDDTGDAEIDAILSGAAAPLAAEDGTLSLPSQAFVMSAVG